MGNCSNGCRNVRCATGAILIIALPTLLVFSSMEIQILGKAPLHESYRISQSCVSGKYDTAVLGRPLEALAKFIDPFVRGFFNYYGRFSRSECKRVLGYLNRVLVHWAARKYKRFKRRKRKAERWLAKIADRDTELFALWKSGVRPRTAGW